MRSYEILFESYAAARKKFIQQGAPDTDVNYYLKAFRELVQTHRISGSEKDLTTWIRKGWIEFVDFVDQVIHTSSNKEIKKLSKGPAIKLVDNDDMLVVVPLCKEASQFYGRGTSWCTAATKSYNYFEDYFFNDSVVLIYLISKKNGKKFAIAISGDHDNSYFDETDENVSESDVERALGISYLDEKILAWCKEVSTAIIQTRQQREKDELEKGRQEALQDAHSAVDYAILHDMRSWPEAEEMISKNPYEAARYAVSVLGERWSTGEPAILQSTRAIYTYARMFITKEWKEGEIAMLRLYNAAFVERWDEDDYIGDLMQYLSFVKKERWPALEQILLSRPVNSFSFRDCLRYAEFVRDELETDWPECDIFVIKHCLNDPERFVSYAQHMYWRSSYQWPAGEAALLQTLSHLKTMPSSEQTTTFTTALMYSTRMYSGNRWPEFEKLLLSQGRPDQIEAYQRYCLHYNPWPAGEEAIRKYNETKPL